MYTSDPAQYPINDFPSQCGEGNLETEEFSSKAVDTYSDRHDPGCWCPACQAPYTFPYVATQKACGNPACTCGDCNKKNKCKCYSETNQLQQLQLQQSRSQQIVHPMSKTLLDVGLMRENGLSAHIMLPGLGLRVDVYALIKYVLIIALLSYLMIHLMK